MSPITWAMYEQSNSVFCFLYQVKKQTGKQMSELESKVLSLEWTLAHAFDI